MEHSQAAGPSWPMEIFHTMDVMLSLSRGAGQGAGVRSSLFQEFKASLVR